MPETNEVLEKIARDAAMNCVGMFSVKTIEAMSAEHWTPDMKFQEIIAAALDKYVEAMGKDEGALNLSYDSEANVLQLGDHAKPGKDFSLPETALPTTYILHDGAAMQRPRTGETDTNEARDKIARKCAKRLGKRLLESGMDRKGGTLWSEDMARVAMLDALDEYAEGLRKDVDSVFQATNSRRIDLIYKEVYGPENMSVDEVRELRGLQLLADLIVVTAMQVEDGGER